MRLTKLFIAILIVIGLLYIPLRMYLYKYIQPDEIGVWMRNGGQNGIKDYESWQGHFPLDINPLTRGFIIPAQPWTIDMVPDGGLYRTYYSQQKGEWRADPQITFKVDRSQSPLVCFLNSSMLTQSDKESKEKFLESIGKNLLIPIVHDVLVEIVGTRSDSILMSNTYFYQRMVEDSVRVRIKRVGYELQTFVSNLTPPQTIIAKNRAKNESEAAALTARADVIKAEAEAKVKLANAKADAEAMLVTERANAEAYVLRARSISPLTLKQEWISKWDGKLPQYTANADLFIGLK